MIVNTKNISIETRLLKEIDNIDEIISNLDSSLCEYLKFFKVEKIPKIDIKLYKSTEEYEEEMYQIGKEIDEVQDTFDPITKNIYYVYDKNKIILELRKQIIHLLFYEVYKDKYERKIWLDEGLAANLSTKKMTDQEFKNWYLSKIVSKDKVIPEIEYLNKPGKRFGCFLDEENNTYNGYDMSYAIVRYLLDVYGKNHLSNFIQDKDQIEEIEKKVIPSMIKYYEKLFKIKEIKQTPQEIKTVEQLIDYVNINFKYGFYNMDGVLKTTKDKKGYYVNSIEEILSSHVGTSFERAIFAKTILNNLNIENKTVIDTEKWVAYPLVKQLDWKQLNWKSGLIDYEEKDNLVEIDEIPYGLTFEELKEYVKTFKDSKQK